MSDECLGNVPEVGVQWIMAGCCLGAHRRWTWAWFLPIVAIHLCLQHCQLTVDCSTVAYVSLLDCSNVVDVMPG